MMNEIYFDIPKMQVNNLPKKQVLVFIKSEENEVKNIELLKNIIKALKIDFDEQVFLCELKDENYIIKYIPDTYTQLISFGIDFEKIGFHLDPTPYKIYKFEKYKVILSHSLNELNTDQNKKGQLWKSLQLMFGLIK